MATFKGTAGVDVFHGSTNKDVFNFAADDLSSADTVDGGTGSAVDKLRFITAGTIAAGAFIGVSHIERLILANGGPNDITLTDSLVNASDDDHTLRVFGSSGTDRIDASLVTAVTNKIHFVSGGGTETLFGGAGADIFTFDASELTSADTVNGGTGTSLDRLIIDTAGSLSSSAFQNVSHIEQILLGKGGNHAVSLTDALVGSADNVALFTVRAPTDSDDAVDASAVIGASYRVRFDTGAGNDTLTGGAGNDIFWFAPPNLTSGDTIDGGGGHSLDRIKFTAPGTVDASAFLHVSNIEALVLANGTNNFVLPQTLVDSAHGGTLHIGGGTGNDTIDASAVRDPADHIVFQTGRGMDTLTGGISSDTFRFTANELTSADSVNGGTASALDVIDFITAGTITASDFTHVSHIEQINLADGLNHIALTDGLARSCDAGLLTVLGGDGDDKIDASAVGASSTPAGTGPFTEVVVPPYSQSIVRDINDLGQVIGSAYDQTTHPVSFKGADGSYDILPGLNDSTDNVFGINDDGVIVGFSGSSAHGIVIENGAITTFRVGTSETYLTGINNDGVMVGYTLDSAANAYRGFVFDHGTITPLNFSGADSTAPAGINDSGMVVGNYQATHGGAPLSFIYRDGQFTTITIPGATEVDAHGINDSGQIVGDYYSNSGLHGFIDTDGVITTIDAPGASGGTVVTGINDIGQIAGYYLVGGTSHGFVEGAGAAGVRFEGGGGADTLIAGGGADVFVYGAGSDSTSGQYDRISGLDFTNDRIDVPVSIGAIDASLTTGALSTATFDADLMLAVDGAHLATHDALLFTPDAGTLSGQTFLVLDLNGIAGYQGGADLVIHLAGETGTLATTDFV